MTSVYVLFKDGSSEDIDILFTSPQDETIYPGIIEIDESDDRILKFKEKYEPKGGF